MKAANAKTVSRSPAPAMDHVLVGAREIGKEIERAGDEDGPAERTGAVESSGRVRLVFDTVEVPFGAPREFLLVDRPRARRTGGDEGPCATGEDREHRVDVL